jgi:hypothetical protein
MILLTLAQLIVFFTYVGFIYNRYGKLTSISASTDYLEGNERWYFLLFLWLFGGINMFQGLGALGFLAGAGLIFSGITIDHSSEKTTYWVHTIATVTAILATFLALIIFHGMWIPTVLLAATTLLLRKNRYFIWYIEIIAVILAIGGYLLR